MLSFLLACFCLSSVCHITHSVISRKQKSVELWLAKARLPDLRFSNCTTFFFIYFFFFKSAYVQSPFAPKCVNKLDLWWHLPFPSLRVVSIAALWQALLSYHIHLDYFTWWTDTNNQLIHRPYTQIGSDVFSFEKRLHRPGREIWKLGFSTIIL